MKATYYWVDSSPCNSRGTYSIVYIVCHSCASVPCFLLRRPQMVLVFCIQYIGYSEIINPSPLAIVPGAGPVQRGLLTEDVSSWGPALVQPPGRMSVWQSKWFECLSLKEAHGLWMKNNGSGVSITYVFYFNPLENRGWWSHCFPRLKRNRSMICVTGDTWILCVSNSTWVEILCLSWCLGKGNWLCGAGGNSPPGAGSRARGGINADS